MNAEQPYPARIHVVGGKMLEVRMYATEGGDPQPHVQHEGVEYVHIGGTSVMGGVTTYDYMPNESE